MFDFGIRLKELREKHGMTQEQLGRRIGRSKSVISSYENNIKIPPVDILTEMAVIYNVSLDYLVGIDKNEMVSVSGMTDSQKDLIQMIAHEFNDNRRTASGLSERQQAILNGLMQEFAKK